MENAVNAIIGYIIPVIEGCGALVITLEVLRTIGQYLLALVRRQSIPTRALRARLGCAMVMGLEFQVAADILRTATAPTWNDILLLAALIALRTILNFFLEQEIKALTAEKPEDAA